MDLFLWLLLLLLVPVAWVAGLVWSARHFRLGPTDAEVYKFPLSTEGSEIAFVRYRPERLRFREPVILCHGLAANRFNLDFYEDGTGSDRRSLARYLARRGFDAWVLELRGTGLARVAPGSDWTVDDEVAEDIPTAVHAVLESTGAERVWWVGHSKGGIMQYLFLGRKGPGSEKIAGLVAIGSPGTLQYQRKFFNLLIAPGRMLTRVLGRVPMRWLAIPLIPLATGIHVFGRRLLPVMDAMDGAVLRRLFANLPADVSRGVANQLMDWAQSEDGALFDLDGQRDDERFHQIEVPALLIAGSQDPLAPPAAVKHVADRIGSKDMTFTVIGKEQGSPVEFGHGDLLIGEHAPEVVFPVVGDWLEKHANRVGESESESESEGVRES